MMSSLGTLDQAYDCASNIYKTRRNVPGYDKEEQFLVDLSALIVDAINSMEAKEPVSETNFVRIARYAKHDSQSHLLRLGFSLSILLRKLLKERADYVLPSAPVLEMIQVHPDSSRERLRNGSEEYQEDDEEDETESPFLKDDIKEEPDDYFEQTPSAAFAEGDLDAVIKEEPVDATQIKVEEEDYELNEYAEVKMEEDDGVPMKDAFCPTTGSSRPIDRGNSYDDYDYNDEEEEEIPTSHLQSTNNTVLQALRQIEGTHNGRMNNPNGKRLLTKVHPSMQQKRPMPNTGIPSTRKCYLCGEVTEEFTATPFNSGQRDAFLRRIAITSDLDRIRLSALKASGDHAYFCTDHVKPNQITYAFEKQKSIKKAICDLCDDPENPCTMAPNKETQKANRFFGRLRKLTPYQQEKIRWMQSSDRNAIICSKHFTKPEERKLEKSLLNVEKCDLCDDPEYPCKISPKDLSESKKFLDLLYFRTERQRLKIRSFIENPSERAAIICMRHFKIGERHKLQKPFENYDLVQSTVNLVQQRELRKGDFVPSVRGNRVATGLASRALKRKAQDQYDEPDTSDII